MIPKANFVTLPHCGRLIDASKVTSLIPNATLERVYGIYGWVEFVGGSQFSVEIEDWAFLTNVLTGAEESPDFDEVCR